MKRSVIDSRSTRTTRNAASSSAFTTAAAAGATNGIHQSSSFKPNGVSTNGIGPSTVDNGYTDGGGQQTGMIQWQKKQELKRRIADMDADILGLKESIKSLNTQLSSKESQKESMVRTLHELERASHAGALQSGGGGGGGGGGSKTKGINYMDGDFDWMGGLKARMKGVFGIHDFRLCQRGYVSFSCCFLFVGL